MKRFSSVILPRICCAGALALAGLTAFAAADAPAPGAPGADNSPMLWYRAPAAQWVEALPVGNGRLGAMVFGGIHQERIQLNEDTLWAGGPYDPSKPEALAALPEVRRLIAAGDHAAAQKLAGEKLMSHPLTQMPYETLGDLVLTFAGAEPVASYRRELNLDTAVAKTEYTIGDGPWALTQTREVFASPADQVIVVRVTAETPSRPGRGQVSFTLGMDTPQSAASHTEGDDTLLLDGRNGGAAGI
ncbi:MAG TPA: glycoside hydrolase family 95 protein, partial [Opitutus sp.]|nr:glycoside hydrolase family 95 protein [Opitutus sp.]